MKQNKPSQFGGKIEERHLKKYQQSPNWRDGKFQNFIETKLSFSPFIIPRIIYKQLTNVAKRAPQKPIEVDTPSFDLFMEKDFSMVWFGHSVILMRIAGKTLLIDPMFGPTAAPIMPGGPKRFSPQMLDMIDKLPEIDLVLFTHDHYDHLDLESVLKIKGKVGQYFVALGVARHLEAWGVSESQIQEFDWWDTHPFEQINITFTPTRHFAGRGAFDRQKSLWGGWVFDFGGKKIWFSGDGGYGDHFKEVGRRLGPFDFGLMECGQYNDDWRPVHLFPDESVQAAIDAGVQKIMPVHWGGFSLSYQHGWKEPAEAFAKEAENAGLPTIFPRIGEVFNVDQLSEKHWWAGLD